MSKQQSQLAFCLRRSSPRAVANFAFVFSRVWCLFIYNRCWAKWRRSSAGLWKIWIIRRENPPALHHVWFNSLFSNPASAFKWQQQNKPICLILPKALPSFRPGADLLGRGNLQGHAVRDIFQGKFCLGSFNSVSISLIEKNVRYCLRLVCFVLIFFSKNHCEFVDIDCFLITSVYVYIRSEQEQQVFVYSHSH